jgi:hypothetical protein
MPQLSQPGYRDQSVPTVATALLYVGCVEQAKQVFDILRRDDMAGYWREAQTLASLPAVAKHPEFQRFRAEGEAATTRLRAKYGG